jgi:hypothetical protein
MSRSMSSAPGPQAHQTLVLPSQTAPSWGASVDILFRETNTILSRAQIAVTATTIGGLAGGPIANTPRYVPACFWFERIEVLVSNAVVEVINGDSIFLKHQCFFSDEHRHLANQSMGIYSSVAQRAAMAAATSTYIVDLGSWVANSPLISTNVHQLTFRCVFKNIGDVVEQGALTGDPTGTITSLQLIADVSRVDPGWSNGMFQSLVKAPRLYPFQPVLVTSQTIPSGTTSQTIVLNNVVGKVLYHFIFLRDLSAERGPTYLPISSYDIQDSSGTNMNPATLSRSQYAAVHSRWATSTYLLENSLGVTDNNSNVILFSHTKYPAQTVRTGEVMNSRTFSGAESVRLTFPSTAHTSEIVVLSYISGGVQMTVSGATAINF